MRVDTQGYEIISSKHYLVGKWVMNGRHNTAERFRRVTITKFNIRDRQTEIYILTVIPSEKERETETEIYILIVMPLERKRRDVIPEYLRLVGIAC